MIEIFFSYAGLTQAGLAGILLGLLVYDSWREWLFLMQALASGFVLLVAWWLLVQWALWSAMASLWSFLF